MPDIQTETPATRPPPVMHPMDPANGENLSPKFAAILAWAIGRPAMTEPAITGIVVTGSCVYASTTHDPFFNALLGSWSDVEANLRGWGTACGADDTVIDGLVNKVRGASR